MVTHHMNTSILPALSLSLVVAIFQPVEVLAGEMLNDGYKNYFFKDSQEKTYRLIRAVEIHHLQPALKHLSSGHPGRAIPELRFVLKYIPNHPKALQLMGVVSRLSNQSKVAEQYFAQAVRVFPNYALTHAQFGKFLVDVGRFEEGIEELERAQSIQPDLKIVYVWLSEAYQKDGDDEKAKLAEEKVKELESKKKKPSTPE